MTKYEKFAVPKRKEFRPVLTAPASARFLPGNNGLQAHLLALFHPSRYAGNLTTFDASRERTCSYQSCLAPIYSKCFPKPCFSGSFNPARLCLLAHPSVRECPSQ